MMEFEVAKSSQLAEVIGGEEKRAEERSLIVTVVPPVVLGARASPPDYSAWERRAPACSETPRILSKPNNWGTR